jgi:ElaB/YqjD/DUF883 family membrane-anchored ribosome-binding protein
MAVDITKLSDEDLSKKIKSAGVVIERNTGLIKDAAEKKLIKLKAELESRAKDVKKDVEKVETKVEKDVKKVAKTVKEDVKKVEKAVKKVVDASTYGYEKGDKVVIKGTKYDGNTAVITFADPQGFHYLVELSNGRYVGREIGLKFEDIGEIFDKKGFLKVLTEDNNKQKFHSKSKGYYINESYVPYDKKYSTRVYFVSGDNGDEFGQFPTLAEARKKLSEIKKVTVKPAAKNKKPRVSVSLTEKFELTIDGKVYKFADLASKEACEKATKAVAARYKEVKEHRASTKEGIARAATIPVTKRISDSFASIAKKAVSEVPKTKIDKNPEDIKKELDEVEKAFDNLFDKLGALMGKEIPKSQRSQIMAILNNFEAKIDKSVTSPKKVLATSKVKKEDGGMAGSIGFGSDNPWSYASFL